GGREREDDVVLGGGSLQLDIELAAKALAQRQTPSAVEAAAEGRMDDELHAADLVEETLEHDRVLRRQAGQRRVGRSEIVEQLLGGGLTNPNLIDEPAQPGLGRFAAPHPRADTPPH